jgi:pyruvate,water dikinase
MAVTVDAEENIIYEGIVEELLEYELEAEDVFRDLREYRILRKLLRRITPLNLIDPNSSSFTARSCRTYHDILRFSHEKAMQELANLNLLSRRFRGVKAQRLKLPIPLGLSIIDLSCDPGEEKAEVIKSPDDICSEPMKAILKGLTAPGVWSTHPVQLGLGDFISSLTRYSATDHSPQYQGQNLAVISPNYVNLSLRLGYHFNVIDAYVSENINDNYIYFRFVGGVTENDRRHRRALALKKILERMHFIVMLRGDLVVSRLKKWDKNELLHILEWLGKLIGFTRQLDTQMLNDEAVDIYTEEFFKRFEGKIP